MKTFRLGYDAKAYNSKLRDERVKRSLSRREMANFLDIPYPTYCNLERMKYYPSPAVKGKIEEKLALLSEDLFPAEISNFSCYGGAVERDVPVELLELDAPETMLLSSPGGLDDVEYAVDHAELKVLIEKGIETLRPRERKVIEMLYGLNDGVEMSAEDVAQTIGVGRQRVYQIRNLALRKMRHPMRSKGLAAYL